MLEDQRLTPTQPLSMSHRDNDRSGQTANLRHTPGKTLYRRTAVLDDTIIYCSHIPNQHPASTVLLKDPNTLETIVG